MGTRQPAQRQTTTPRKAGTARARGAATSTPQDPPAWWEKALTDDQQPLRVNPDFEREWPGSQRSATELVLNLMRTADTISTHVNQIARRHDIPSSTAMILLEILHGTPAGLTPSQLAQRCFVTRPTLSGILDTLLRRKMIERTATVHDRRSSTLTITQHGSDKLEQTLRELHQLEAGLCSQLTPARRENVIQALARIPRGTPAVS